jgi:glycosyltransferase involved in cell wall biosynthesis
LKLPVISILLPVHNSAETLLETLQSLSAQSFSDFEIVAVENGSNDDSWKLLCEYTKTDPRLELLQQPTPNLVDALNFGLDKCTGKYIARMDADDLCHPQRLEKQLALLEQRPEVDVCSCGVEIFSQAGVRDGYRNYQNWVNGLVKHEDMARERFVESFIPHPSAMFRAEWIARMNGYRDMGWPEDYDLWLRGLDARSIYAKCNDILLQWRDGGERLSRNDDAYSTRSFLCCKAHFIARYVKDETRPLALWGAGPIGRKLLRFLLLEGASPEIVIDIDPNKIGNSRRGRPIVAPDALLEKQYFVLTAVGKPGARTEIREKLAELKYIEGIDFLCCA